MDENAVVDGDGKEHGYHSEDGHGTGRDLEGLGEVSVHGLSLLEGECVLLGIGCDEEDSGCPYWSHPDHGFQFFNSMNCV